MIVLIVRIFYLRRKEKHLGVRVAFLIGGTDVALFNHSLYSVGTAGYLYYLGMMYQPGDNRIGDDGIASDGSAY